MAKQLENFIIITRPDGAKLHMNTGQIVYVTEDPIDQTGNKTEIVTTSGAFIVNKRLTDVLTIIKQGGEL